uniref:AEC family transporter n=1 Tax=Cellvibrio fontiphilus TaxID=1815559 RepID=UPI002B4C1E34|nr:AEC family transporter [Cellvibrio fontiphilus]
MLTNALTTFTFAFSITAPIFVVLFLGTLLKKRGMIDESFIKTASSLVFNIGLPVMLFTTSASADFSHIADINVLVAFTLMTLLVFAGSLLTTHWFTREPRDHGVIIQGAFRGNLVILGLAFCANAYGERGLATATLPVAMTVVLYNVLSIYVLNRSLQRSGNSFTATLNGIIKNPLMLAIAAGLLFNASGLTMPVILLDSGKYLSQMVLPLALICIGGALDLSQLKRIDAATLSATVWKLILSPLLACGIAIGLGVRGENLAILFVLAACPSATVSFVMVQAMKGNALLAANIVVQTTLWSLLSVTIGLWLLEIFNLI